MKGGFIMSLVSWIALIIVILLALGAIFVVAKDKIEGKPSCGGYCAGCSGCSGGSGCSAHQKKHEAKKS